MKTILTKLSNEKAQKEVKQFALLALVCSVLGFLLLWPLAIGGIAFGGRALLLTWHKGNAGRKNLIGYRILASLALGLGILSLALAMGAD